MYRANVDLWGAFTRSKRVRPKLLVRYRVDHRDLNVDLILRLTVVWSKRKLSGLLDNSYAALAALSTILLPMIPAWPGHHYR